MAKIVGGSPLGMLSGKMGGIVFSFNQAGPYIRQYVKPVNPNTDAQILARSSFGTASGGYHNLSPTIKSNWGVFANSVYNPLRGANTGQFSGFNAYVAINTAINHAQNLAFESQPQVNGSPPGTPATFLNFLPRTSPPNLALSANLKESVGGGPLPLSLGSVDLKANGAGSVRIVVNGGVDGGSDIEAWKDVNNNEFGIAVFSSNALEQEGLFWQNPLLYHVVSMKAPVLDATDKTGIEFVDFAWNSVINPGNYQSFPQLNQKTLISVYCISDTGMFAKIGSIDSTVSAAP